MQSSLSTPLFRLAFRAFFLFGSLYSLLGILGWLLILNGQLSLSPYGGALFWHSHEMLFGFVSAIVVGFLLTAVQTWTSMPGIKGVPLFALWSLWLAGRLGALFTWQHPLVFAVIDLAFLPCAAFILARPIFKIRQYRNMMFVPVLLFMAVANGLTHTGILYDQAELINQGNHLAVWLVVFIMSMIGGRVIPMFTANGTKTRKAEPIHWLEKLTLGSTLVLAGLYGLNAQTSIPSQLLALLLFVAGISHAARWLRWRFWVTYRVPLVWSLHSAYCFIPLGLLTASWSAINNNPIASSTLLHFFTAGAMGSLIIAMMARVSLGHSGRPLAPHPAMTVAFASVFAAGLIRSLLVATLPQWHSLWTNLSGSLWIIAFALFVALYTPILGSARRDGKPG